ncbi:MAG: hypothetical protein AAFR59_17085 [Bacteroidota bacterium]
MSDHFDQLMNEPEGKLGLNLSVFKDPLAAQVSWEPMHPEGNSFTTHKLDLSRSEVISFQPTTWAKIIPIIFAMAGGILIALAIFDSAGANIMLYIGILLFLMAAALIADQLIVSTSFDKQAGKVTQKRILRHILGRPDALHTLPLSDVYALQILSERITTYDEENDRKSAYRSYELNLILKNKERFHILDHADRQRIQVEAEQLAVFLEIPVWDQVKAKLLPEGDEH